MLPRSNTPLRRGPHTADSTAWNSGGSNGATSATAHSSASSLPSRSQSFASTESSMMSTPNRYSSLLRTEVRQVVLYRRRWLMLFINFMLNTANSIVWVAVSSVQSPAAELYGVSEDSIVLLTNLVYAIFIPGTILSSWLLNTYGLYSTGAAGALLLTCASWLRVFSAFRGIFSIEVIASVAYSLGQPLVMNGVAKFGHNWMPPRERFLSTMVYNTVPASLGAAILNIVAAKRVTKPEQVPAYLLLIASVVTIISILFLLTFQERPPTPPEYRAPKGMRSSSTARGCDPIEDQKLRNEAEAERLGVGYPCIKCRSAARNGPFMCCLILSTTTVLIICAYPASAYNILHPLGYNQGKIDDLTAIFFVTGIVGAIVVAPLADCVRSSENDAAEQENVHTERSNGRNSIEKCCSMCSRHSTKIFLVILMLISTGSSFLLYLSAEPDNFRALAFAVGSMSFAITAIIPISLETGSATAQNNLSEANSSGIMIATGNLFGFALVYIIEGVKSPRLSLSILIGINAVGLLAAACLCSGDRRMLNNDSEDAFVPKLFRTPANSPSRVSTGPKNNYSTI